MALKMSAHQNTLKDLLTTGQNLEFISQETPPSSEISSLSPAHSLPSSPEYSSQIKEESDEESMGISKGLMDTSRLTLCMFMFAVISFNPFQYVLSQFKWGSDDDKTVYGRTTLGKSNINRRVEYNIFLSVIYAKINIVVYEN